MTAKGEDVLLPQDEKQMIHNDQWKKIKDLKHKDSKKNDLTSDQIYGDQLDYWNTIQQQNETLSNLNMQNEFPKISLSYNSYASLYSILNELLQNDSKNIADIIIYYLHIPAIPFKILGGICRTHSQTMSQIDVLQRKLNCERGCSGGTSSYNLFIRLCQSQTTNTLYGEIQYAYVETRFITKSQTRPSHNTVKHLKRTIAKMTVFTPLPVKNIIHSIEDYDKYDTPNHLIDNNEDIYQYGLDSIQANQYFIQFYYCPTSIGTFGTISRCDPNGNTFDTIELYDWDNW